MNRTREFAVVTLAAATLTLIACAGTQPRSADPTQGYHAAPALARSPLAPYLDTLSAMAPGDSARQQAELASTLAAMQQSPSSANTLRYALAIGTAGQRNGNPADAKRLLTDLLAGPNDLSPEARELAAAYLREFESRAALGAELAKQREETEQKLRSNDSTAEKRADTLEAENARLKKQLAEAQRKLEAVAEMERSLQEQAQPQPESPPQRP
ncbi:MAG: hypothetical protein U1F09_05825 [Steroidobacteraceae bacterium]